MVKSRVAQPRNRSVLVGRTPAGGGKLRWWQSFVARAALRTASEGDPYTRKSEHELSVIRKSCGHAAHPSVLRVKQCCAPTRTSSDQMCSAADGGVGG